jgi:hypothetical protein
MQIKYTYNKRNIYNKRNNGDDNLGYILKSNLGLHAIKTKTIDENLKAVIFLGCHHCEGEGTREPDGHQMCWTR